MDHSHVFLPNQEIINPEGETEMPKEEAKSRPRRVFKVSGVENADVTIAGNTIAENAPLDALPKENVLTDMEVTLENIKGGKHEVAENVLRYNQAADSPLDELVNLLSKTLMQQDEIEHLQKLVADLQEQLKKPAKARNVSMIKMTLQNIGTFLGLASLAANQAEKAKQLFETVKGTLLGS
jgi:hypothetical protein